MRTLIFFYVLFVAVAAGATTYTEFFVEPASGMGTNVNSGTTTNATATYTSLNGNWDGTSIYTPVDGSTPASTVTTNTFASVYLDGATNAVYLARIESVAAGVNGAITLSTTAVGGTAPTSGATGRSIKVGGAWSGPRSSSTVPFGVLKTTCTNVAGNTVRCNWRSGSSNVITVGITESAVGPMHHEGYLAVPGDGLGRFIIDANAANITILSFTGVNTSIANAILQNNSTSGTGSGLLTNGGEHRVSNCVVNNVGGRGFYGQLGTIYTECEAYRCNRSGTTDYAGFYVTGTGSALFRCYSHDNTNAPANGFLLQVANTGGFFAKDCIAHNNGSNGFTLGSQTITILSHCNSFSNGYHGIDLHSTVAAAYYIENCAIFNNTGYGINSSGSLLLRDGMIRSCMFGSGTQTNALGNVVAGLNGIDVDTPLIYAANTTPWTAPTTGNFTPTANTAIINAGRGTFIATAAGYSPTLSYPDIGAAQITNAATTASSSQFSFPLAQ